jgi:ribonuclease R
LAKNLSYAFVRTEQGDFFVSSEDTMNAFHGDTIAIEPYYKNTKSDYCYIRRIIKRAATSFAGDIQESGGKFYFISSNPKIHQWFNVSDLATATPGYKVILEVTNWGNKQLNKPPTGKVTEVLGISGNPEVELLAVIRQNNLPLEFPEPVLAEVARISEKLDDMSIGKRKDYRALDTFTIDPASAKDYDDAITLETSDSGWKLYVHIADVAHYVKSGSALFAEAEKRGNSYYFPRKVIPMLPETLSNGYCSLRPNEDKLTLTVVTSFDKRGKIQHQEIWESVIRSKSRLTYEQVDEHFDGKQTLIPANIRKQLDSARDLSKLLTRYRNIDGYLLFDLPETEYLYNDEGFIYQMNSSAETESHKLIENFMLIANQYVAERLTEVAPFTMYRVHEFPDWDRLERLSIMLTAYGLKLEIVEDMNHSLQRLLKSMPDETYHKVFDRYILRSLKKAKYTPELLPHFGLAIDTYTHFTSPIRRLCDLVIHHLCKQYLIHSAQSGFTKEQIKHYSTVASEKEIIADKAERDIERTLNCAYMRDRIGDKYTGLVVGMNSSGMIIRLNELPITGVLKTAQLTKGKWFVKDNEMRLINERSGYFYQLMDTLILKVINVSDDVYFEPVDEPGAHKHHVSYLMPTEPISRKKGNSGSKNYKPKPPKRKRHEKTNRHF